VAEIKDQANKALGESGGDMVGHMFRVVT